MQAAEAQRLQQPMARMKSYSRAVSTPVRFMPMLTSTKSRTRRFAARLPVERAQCAAVVGERVKLHGRVFLHERDEGRDCRPDERVSEQNMRGAGFCRHLSLGERRALEAADAHFHLHFEHRAHFVRFHVRPKALGPAGDLDRAPRVLADPVRVIDQGGGKDLPPRFRFGTFQPAWFGLLTAFAFSIRRRPRRVKPRDFARASL